MIKPTLEPGHRVIASLVARVSRVKRGMVMTVKICRRSLPKLTSGLILLSLIATAGQSSVAFGLPARQITSDNSTTMTSQAKISPTLVTTLQQDLSQRTGKPAKQFRLVSATPQTWSDGCLGLGRSDEMCLQALVNGWRVVFANSNQRWVYRTDATGRSYRLESGQSKSDRSPDVYQPVSLQPAQIPSNELPPQLAKDAVFRAISTGGFAGQTFQTTLYRDGRLIRQQLRPDGTAMSSQMRQLTPQQVRQFVVVVQQNRLAKLHRADYQPDRGSADFITTTLSCQSCAVRYADSVQAQLPANLQTVIQAWSELTGKLSI